MADFRPAPVKPEVSIDLLDALDVRVGTITSVVDVTDADRVMQIQVDFGDHRRSVVAGIKQERDDPQELVGRQALFVVNLPPRRIKGVVSEGMLFDIGYADGLVAALAIPERPAPNGIRVG